VVHIYPIRLEASLHETLWGGQRLERDGWKHLPSNEVAIGEAWETEISTVVQNGPYAGKTLGELVEIMDVALLGEQSMSIFGRRFPLLAKFIDANAKLSVQVHPDDAYAAKYEGGKLGKTEFWYVLAAEPDATIVHGFRERTSREEIRKAIEEVRLETLLHEEPVTAGDVIFVPAGTVHAIGSGVMLYELQEYSDITYRLYDYGRLSTAGTPRELHVERSLDVCHYDVSSCVKARPCKLPPTSLPSASLTPTRDVTTCWGWQAGGDRTGYQIRCLVASPYFVTCETLLDANDGYVKDRADGSCVILTSLGADIELRYGQSFRQYERLSRGQTMVLPAALGDYSIHGTGTFVTSYVPAKDDAIWRLWREQNNIG
jgi:mannose-6-phosphate isomerase